MLKNDISRNRVVTAVIFTFVLLATMLVAAGSSLVMDLTSSLDVLFTRSQVPHFVQMHAGEIDRNAVDSWSRHQPEVKEYQIVEMISIDGSDLYLGTQDESERESVMDISFVQQNPLFDYLLDTENTIAHLMPGEIGVPIYYREERNIRTGDTITIKTGSFEKRFTVTTFIRDPQMNTSLVHSKRFLIHPDDYRAMGTMIQDREYLVEYLLHDADAIEAFADHYEAADLPDKGPAVDVTLFRVLNSLSDGLAAGLVILLSVLVMIIAILCLRFTILSTIQEDFREIGVMKATGVSSGIIRWMYLAKYLLLSGTATMAGYFLSIPLGKLLQSGILTYIGTSTQNSAGILIPLMAASSILLIAGLSVALILRRCNTISAVEAIRNGRMGNSESTLSVLSLHNRRKMGVNTYLGLADILRRFRVFALLIFVFFFSTALILVPVNFLTTIQSPSFISYMGIGRSQIRIDLRQSDQMHERFQDMIAIIDSDPDVATYAALVTSQFSILHDSGETARIDIETGDFSLFPLDYIKGHAPSKDNEIALSVLNSKEMGKDLGDRLIIRNGVDDIPVTVSGIYQDVTNGGRTAKATLVPNEKKILWYTINCDLQPDSDIDSKIQYFSQTFHPARVTDINGYLSQTLGTTIKRLRSVTKGTVFTGLLMAMLITSLFLRMLISRDASDIAVMKSLGFSQRDLRLQYLTRSLTLLFTGIGTGTLFANTVGQKLVSLVWSFMGASHIRFVIDPVQAYLLYPLLLAATVALTTIASIGRTGSLTISNIISE